MQATSESVPTMVITGTPPTRQRTGEDSNTSGSR